MGFSFLPLGGARKVEYVRLNSGVTRNFDQKVWDRIKDYDNVKRMLSLGALVVTEAGSETVVAAAAPVVNGTESIESVKLNDALTLIESSFDLEQLSKWDAKESRIRVKNAIQQRKVAITEGKG